jgi:hypothetical protein
VYPITTELVKTAFFRFFKVSKHDHPHRNLGHAIFLAFSPAVCMPITALRSFVPNTVNLHLCCWNCC